ncbi:hypothetical protein V6N13_063745 [Hibiscus sabdariffa]|uniref:Uncharacterized protein n=1 Tax=Hibiscus sabdariffa TaxID=183260 RepID=A0ABR2R147_9ROSI
MVDEKKREKVKNGWLVVQVGTEEDDGGLCRFVIPISYLYHPHLKRLLEKKMEPMKAPVAESSPNWKRHRAGELELRGLEIKW